MKMFLASLTVLVCLVAVRAQTACMRDSSACIESSTSRTYGTHTYCCDTLHRLELNTTTGQNGTEEIQCTCVPHAPPVTACLRGAACQASMSWSSFNGAVECCPAGHSISSRSSTVNGVMHHTCNCRNMAMGFTPAEQSALAAQRRALLLQGQRMLQGFRNSMFGGIFDAFIAPQLRQTLQQQTQNARQIQARRQQLQQRQQQQSRKQQLENRLQQQRRQQQPQQSQQQQRMTPGSLNSAFSQMANRLLAPLMAPQIPPLSYQQTQSPTGSPLSSLMTSLFAPPRSRSSRFMSAIMTPFSQQITSSNNGNWLINNFGQSSNTQGQTEGQSQGQTQGKDQGQAQGQSQGQAQSQDQASLSQV